MEELFELRSYIEQRRYTDALSLIGEMEEMSKDDKINKIRSHTVILLLHLIKQRAQKYTTRSWELSINNALEDIIYTNKRRKAGGYYLDKNELKTAINEAWRKALRYAAAEAFEGKYTESEMAQMINEEEIKKEALQKILDFQNE